MNSLKIYIRIVFSALIYLFRLTPFQRNKSQQFNVINYHYFLNDKEIINDESLEVNYEIFEKQVYCLKKKFKKFLSIVDLEKFYKNDNDLNKKSILITIDDADYGFLNLLNTINKLQIPVIMFAPLGFCLDQDDINGLRSRCLHFSFFKKNLKSASLKKELEDLYNHIFNLNEKELKKFYFDLTNNKKNFFISKRYMNIQELKYIAKNNLVTLSSHSMSHVPLSFLPEKWLDWEILESQKLIKDCKGDTSFFAYPYGYKQSYNSKVKEILKKYNVKFAFTTLAKVNSKDTDNLELGRTFSINNSNKNYILGSASGALYYFDKFLKRL